VECKITITGRAVDGSGRPCADTNVYVGIQMEIGTTSRYVETNSDGRFRVEQCCDSSIRLAVITVGGSADCVPQHLLRRSVSRDRVVDLGDLVIDDRPFVSWLDDDAAERLLREWGRGELRILPIDALLMDLLRRPRDRWTAVLERLRRDKPSDRDLALLTILRRLQGRPDPVRLERSNPAPLAVEWPGAASIEVKAVNRDVGGASFEAWVPRGEWLAQVVDANGVRVPAASPSLAGGSVLSSRVVIAPGDGIDGGVSLLECVAPLAPGAYRVRVLFHDEDASYWPESQDWLVLSSSAEIPLTVTPRRIATTNAEQASLRSRFAELFLKAPSVLREADYHQWLAERRLTRAALAGASWRAVPMLLDVLEEQHVSPGMRAEALEWLYQLTGIPDPRGFHADVDHPSAEAITQWRAWRRMIEVEVR